MPFSFFAGIDHLGVKIKSIEQNGDLEFFRQSRLSDCLSGNSYARGIVPTLANDTVGTGPRLQLLTGDGETNRIVEQAFARWARESR